MRKEEHQYKKQIKQGSEMEQVNAADREWKDDNVITQYDNKRTREELLGVDADLPRKEFVTFAAVENARARMGKAIS